MRISLQLSIQNNLIEEHTKIETCVYDCCKHGGTGNCSTYMLFGVATDLYLMKACEVESRVVEFCLDFVRHRETHSYPDSSD